MPVDYDNLQVIKKDLNIKIEANRASKKVLADIMNNITSIEKIQDPAFPDDPAKKVDPDDRGLGGKVDASRAQGIYDKIVTDAAAL